MDNNRLNGLEIALSIVDREMEYTRDCTIVNRNAITSGVYGAVMNTLDSVRDRIIEEMSSEEKGE